MLTDLLHYHAHMPHYSICIVYSCISGDLTLTQLISMYQALQIQPEVQMNAERADRQTAFGTDKLL